jgi:hypothetical protein
MTSPAPEIEVREKVEEMAIKQLIDDLDHAAMPTKSDVFTACGSSAARLRDHLRAVLASHATQAERLQAAEAEVERLKAENTMVHGVYRLTEARATTAEALVGELVEALTLARDRMKMLLPATLDGSDHPGATEYVIIYAEAALSKSTPNTGEQS